MFKAFKLSKNQQQKLISVGIDSDYKLLTYLPSGTIEIQPLSNFRYNKIDAEKVKYIENVTLTKIQKRVSKKPFYNIEFETSYGKKINTYLFLQASYITKELIQGNIYQCIFRYSNNFWSLEKFALLNQAYENSNLRLGNSIIKKYIQTKYPSIRSLQSAFFSQIHSQQTNKSIYYIPLKQLVPDNNIIPQIINFNDIHKPSSYNTFKMANQQWLALKVFLKISLSRAFAMDKVQKYSKATKLKSDFVKNFINTLEFELSDSQKQIIWEVLQSLKK